MLHASSRTVNISSAGANFTVGSVINFSILHGLQFLLPYPHIFYSFSVLYTGIAVSVIFS
jgi:hypothetical protein